MKQGENFIYLNCFKKTLSLNTVGNRGMVQKKQDLLCVCVALCEVVFTRPTMCQDITL